jgi:3-methyladenine DNA glycosylase AlkD
MIVRKPSRPSAASILRALKAHASPTNVAGMARFGMSTRKRLGVSVALMRRIAKTAGKDHAVALSLWRTGIPEARIVASMVAVPAAMRADEMDDWVGGFDSWDVCDQVCMNLFDKTALARKKISEWAGRDEEFVRRAAFAVIASLASHDKAASDAEFIGYLPLIEHGAIDARNFVKKAVNWALRNIGKRNTRLNRAAIAAARRLRSVESGAARWVGADALRELEGEAVQKRLRSRVSLAAGRGAGNKSV